MTTSERVVIDGYDLLAETARLDFADRTLCGHTLNRGSAKVSPEGVTHPDYAAVKAAHGTAIMPSTLDKASPVIDLSHPTAGMFVDSPGGVYLDLYQGVAQKVIDEQHPVIQHSVRQLTDHGLAFRREINTDDYETLGTPIDGVHTPQELAELVNRLTGEAFNDMGPTKTFFSNSGAEAGEAAIKLAQLHAYKNFLRQHGPDVLARVMDDLGIARDIWFNADTSMDDPVYSDYPFFVVGCDTAFHGRTMGVLNLTRSKKVQQVGYSKWRWVRHIPFNGEPGDLAALIDGRPIGEILDAPGGVSAVIESGRIPQDLAALFVCEVYQGEGGYTLADKIWIRQVEATCREHSILLGIDEVQSFGRTGQLFAAAHYGITPDILWTAKASVLGVTIASTDLVADCHEGWHSNTFGSGKLFDVNMAWCTWHLLAEHEEALFEGRSLLDNSRIKGEYMRLRLAELSAAYPDVMPEFSGLGGMWGLTVCYREEVIATGWRMGLKMLGCGSSGELSRIRILLLADVLTREIDEMIAVLHRVFESIEDAHPDL